MESHNPMGCGCDVGDTDHGSKPFVTNISREAQKNQNFRTAFWTGCHLQMTLMCIPACGEIGVEVHPDTDQLIRRAGAFPHGRLQGKAGLSAPALCGGCRLCAKRYMAQYFQRRELSAEALINLCAAPTPKGNHTSHKGGCRRREILMARHEHAGRMRRCFGGSQAVPLIK